MARISLRKPEPENRALENRGAQLLRLPAPLLVDVSTVDPGLHTDDAVGGVRLGKAVVDVRPQRVQGKPTLEIPFGTGDLIAVQAARDADLDALAAEAEGRIDRHAHDAAE